MNPTRFIYNIVSPHLDRGIYFVGLQHFLVGSSSSLIFFFLWDSLLLSSIICWIFLFMSSFPFVVFTDQLFKISWFFGIKKSDSKFSAYRKSKLIFWFRKVLNRIRKVFLYFRKKLEICRTLSFRPISYTTFSLYIYHIQITQSWKQIMFVLPWPLLRISTKIKSYSTTIPNIKAGKREMITQTNNHSIWTSNWW